jgi:hypothetical protein
LHYPCVVKGNKKENACQKKSDDDDILANLEKLERREAELLVQ